MKFYDCKTAPSPRRARMFIAEKGLEIATIEVDLAHEEQLSDWFRKLNPRCTVPVLTLEDDTALTENAAIAAYLEAAYPNPPLLGMTPREKGIVSMWNARAELEGLWPVADAFRNRSKGLKDRALTGPMNYAQIPELATRSLARATEFFNTLNERLRDHEYLAGEFFSVADITALCVVDFAAWVKLTIGAEQPYLARWHARVKDRPSAKL